MVSAKPNQIVLSAEPVASVMPQKPVSVNIYRKVLSLMAINTLVVIRFFRVQVSRQKPPNMLV